ncbi:MAG: GntR family transcriptional regulator [Anaerolineae bacterium]|nr:GntR family transcriptional regulator [Anaerolineae bacterium]
MQQITAFRSKNALVYDALRNAVIQGDLKPGERLVIEDLANSLGVSPIPVREALRQLEGDGFVTIEPYVGAMVTEMKPTMICEIFELLAVLETISGRAACERMTEADLNTMSEHLTRMDAALDDPNQWSQYNIAFHLLICEHARTPLVRNTMAKAFDHWDRLRNHYIEDVFVHRLDRAQRQHHEMVETLRRRDADAFVALTQQHNRDALAAYVDYLASKGIIDTDTECLSPAPDG